MKEGAAISNPNLNQTPTGDRLHIGIFGPANVGKSSLINRFTRQSVSIVAQVAGTTTDPVYKPMELHPMGPCILIDTAGFDDGTALGQLRLEKTALAAMKTDIAILALPGDTAAEGFPAAYPEAERWYRLFRERKTPVILLLTKLDLYPQAEETARKLAQSTGETALAISAETGQGIEALRQALARLTPEGFAAPSLIGSLAGPGDNVVLVMPQDIQAPKGRLILPQVQTIRALLDEKALVHCVTTDRFDDMIAALSTPPKLIITDSQVVAEIYGRKPRQSALTTFSILFAAYKGDIDYYVESAKVIPSLTGSSRVLIAECCTHAPLEEDIGRVKIPRLLRKRCGAELQVDLVAGTDFPEDLRPYDLVIQCGGCMFNRKYVLSRIHQAMAQGVPMTNYGVAISQLTGVLDKVALN